MSSLEITVPDVGTESEVEVIEVLVSPGDQISIDDPIMVLESDKASIEVPSDHSGSVTALRVKVGDKVKMGDALLTILPGDSGSENVLHNEKLNGEGQPEIAFSETPDVQIERQILVPDIGSASAVEVIELSVNEGDHLERDQTLIVLESDKATMDIPSPSEGRLLSLNLKVGDKVGEGDVIGTLLEHEVSNAPATTHGADANAESVAEVSREHEKQTEVKTTLRPLDEAKTKLGRESTEEVLVHAGPAVRKLARELGAALSNVKATGPKGRILKDDLLAYVKGQVKAAQQGHVQQVDFAGSPLPDFSKFGEVASHPLDRIQLVTAKNMQASWSNIPHVTQFDEADITDLESFRKSKKAEAEKRAVKLTPLPFLIKACAFALKRMPQFNVSLDLANQQMIQKHYLHIGIAIDTPSGLMVPVIRDVDQKSLWQLANELGELAEKAQAKKLMPNDMQGACFTISSLGSIGGTAFTPIVNQPEVAILGVSKAQMKPQFDGQTFVPRLMLPLSLSYDHRALNGADAARFTTLLGQLLGDIRELLLL